MRYLYNGIVFWPGSSRVFVDQNWIEIFGLPLRLGLVDRSFNHEALCICISKSRNGLCRLLSCLIYRSLRVLQGHIQRGLREAYRKMGSGPSCGCEYISIDSVLIQFHFALLTDTRLSISSCKRRGYGYEADSRKPHAGHTGSHPIVKCGRADHLALHANVFLRRRIPAIPLEIQRNRQWQCC